MERNDIKGNLGIEGNLETGGALKVNGDARLGRNLKVEGYFEAAGFVGFLKGLFPTVESLRRAYPFPRSGWAALVGSTLPADVYRSEYGRWVATGEKGGNPELPLRSLEEALEKEKEERQTETAGLAARIDKLEDSFIYKNAYVYSYSPEEERNDEPDFMCTGYIPLQKGCVLEVRGYEHSDVCAPVLYYDSRFRYIGQRTTGSNGIKDLLIDEKYHPEGSAYVRVNALNGNGKIVFRGGGGIVMETAVLAEEIRGSGKETEKRIASIEQRLSLSVERQEAVPLSGCYFNLRGVAVGDQLRSVVPESTREEGFQAATFSFSDERPRMLILTSKGTDMIRSYAALDRDMRVIAISDESDRNFEERSIHLPAATRHLLLQSYTVSLKAELHSASGNGSESAGIRTITPQQHRGVCYDFGSDDPSGSVFRESDIKFIPSVPYAAVALVEYKEGYRVVVSMNSGTPNVRGIVYLNSGNVVIGTEQPLRVPFTEKTLDVPTGTSRILFQTYDATLYPMSVRIEYDLLDQIERHLQQATQEKPMVRERVALIGDSLLECRDSSGRNAGDYIAEITGCEVLDCAVGGSRLTARRSSYDGNPATEWEALASFDVENLMKSLSEGNLSAQRGSASFLKGKGDDNGEAIAAMERLLAEGADVIVILAGTNDFMSEVGVDDDSPIYGALEMIASCLSQRFPHARIIICTPPPRQVDLADSTTFCGDYIPHGAVAALPDIAGCIAKGAKSLHYAVADLYTELGWNRYNYRMQCQGADGTHPVVGLRNMARYISLFI